jgi:dCTP deaminase
MSIRPDWWIRQEAQKGMIEPFEDRLIRTANNAGVISYGLSSFGYDLRAAPEWRIFVNAFNTVVDPKHFDTNSLVEVAGDTCIIPPNSFALTRSVEYMRIPEDVMVIALGKSSYARCGIVANVTPLEPGWEGHVTLELSNTTPLPAKVYANEGIVQLLFFQGERPEVTYADRKGKYQGQTGVTLPRL